MADEGLEQQYREFVTDLRASAEFSGMQLREAFFDAYSELAAENGDCPDLSACDVEREGRGGYRVDGWAFDAERGVYSVAICDVRDGDELETLNAAQLESLNARARRFVERIIQTDAADVIADGASEDGLVSMAAVHAALVKRVQILVFSSARLATRKPPELSIEIAGRPVVSNVLDFARFSAIGRSRGSVEPVEVDLAALAGAPVPCLAASSGSGGYQSYLLVVPGEVLAGVYGLYGPRLLEQNVRTFLQARTKVNKGIIATVREHPEMFFAYNNGLTATATAVRTTRLADGMLGISSVENLQIVNGGQTTASILYARDQGATLDNVFVQIKLSVVQPQLVEDVVPMISRFSNTQNRISEADFFSGHPFHVTMEQISRRVSPPPRAGVLTGQKWFYERARGQYRDARARGTPAERRRFEAEFPQSQVIEKTDLAKHLFAFAGRPHTVCLGAQKCFLAFAEHIAKEWVAAPLSFNEGWFRAAAARALIFRWTDRMINGADWYRSDRGHKSQTVAYTISWLQHHLRKLGKAGLNLELVWNQQDVPEELKGVLQKLAPQIAAKLKETPEHIRNIGEFAKQQACWALLARADFEVGELPETILLDHEEQREAAREGVAVRRIDADIELDQLMVSLSGRIDEIAAVARKKGLLSPKSDAALRKIGRGQFSLVPSERNALRHLFDRLIESGFKMFAADAPAQTGAARDRLVKLAGSGMKQVRL